MTELHFTTNPGLEDIAAQEFGDRLRTAGLEEADVELRPWGLGGHVLVRHPRSFAQLWPLACQMRSIHHVLHPLLCFPLPPDHPLQAVQAHLRQVEIPGLAQARNFRVTSRRTGEHPFTSLDVQREAGTVLVERCGRPVDLEDPDLNVRVDVHEQTCLVGLQLTPAALSRRYQRRYSPRAALKANVAYALLHLAGLNGRTGALLDPFCGSGTILLEAASLFPGLELYGSDLDPAAVAGTSQNLQAAGLAGRVHLRQADACHLAQVYPAAGVCAIATNPPYGVRLGHHLDFGGLYRRFLEQALAVLAPKGRLVLLVWKQGVFDRTLRQLGAFRVLSMRVVETGGIFPRLFVLERD